MTSVSVGNLIATIQVGNTLGEGVFWDDQSQSIWWTDIEESTIFQYNIDSQQLKRFSMPYRVGSFALIEQDSRIIAAFDRGIGLYQFGDTDVEWLAQPESHLPFNRFNDGKVDRQGRFWAGTMVDNSDRYVMTPFNYAVPSQDELGALYCVDHQAKCYKTLCGIGTSNSLCWSPDSQYLYHADSTKQMITRFNFDIENCALSQAYEFDKTPMYCCPDGADVDEQGFVWSAQWGGGQVVRYDPDGNVVLNFPVPITNPTNVVLGGKNLDWLIITSAKQTLSEQQLANEPQAGDLFIYQLHGIKGIKSTRYKLAR
ncbi:SMP-30/gluconolactonase/LRE family protein [Shewanella sp. Isolate11]|uniref:SMP-30/gluconolactonase/LRE family protein n=1 Tax=Shewanella sp. Isolate11 TaxID=2908530 RepID=UPI001EFD3108|nr:SMP-30/gluconolactonase/LRE family protein [Shewanella sp. Isolate11]MCG9696630.1 SMP-30/gluconolactonase/LRE family protein [Shewanella sp. Isolate11]